MALLNVNQLKVLVAIGQTNRNKFVCNATGFLIGFIARNSKDAAKRLYSIFLITNRHVFEGVDAIDLRMNKKMVVRRHSGKIYFSVTENLGGSLTLTELLILSC